MTNSHAQYFEICKGADDVKYRVDGEITGKLDDFELLAFFVKQWENFVDARCG